MKQNFLDFLGLALFLLGCAVMASGIHANQAEPPQPGVVVRCRVVEVTDGDTVTVEIRQRVRVRLLDCWAPETRTTDPDEKARGLAAKRYVERQAMGKPAILEVPTADARRADDVLTFGRVLGRLWIDGRDLSASTVAAGHATKGRQ